MTAEHPSGFDKAMVRRLDLDLRHTALITRADNGYGAIRRHNAGTDNSPAGRLVYAAVRNPRDGRGNAPVSGSPEHIAKEVGKALAGLADDDSAA